MRTLDYITPKSAADAVALLAEHGESACALAGGTDLVVDLKHSPGNVHILVDVSGLEEFRGIEETDEGLRIGSMATYAEIMENPICLEKTPEVVAARIWKALDVVPAERLVIAPDCGMKYISRDVGFGKLKSMVAGAEIVRAEIG